MQLEDYMAPSYPLEVYPDDQEGGYTISFPDLPGCVTCAESWDEIPSMAEDARRTWTEAMIADNQVIPLPR